jgi:hypothetical protein
MITGPSHYPYFVSPATARSLPVPEQITIAAPNYKAVQSTRKIKDTCYSKQINGWLL